MIKNVFGIMTDEDIKQQNKKHMIYLASCETHYQNTVYPISSDAQKNNSIKRILRYINNRTEEETTYEEYKIFMKAMLKSLTMCGYKKV